jgi:hypothetical protein
MWHVREAGEVHAAFWSGDLMEIHHLEDLGVEGRIILQWIFKKGGRGHGRHGRDVVNAVMDFRV